MYERMTVADAAKALNISSEAVRQRIKRGTIEFEKDENGKYYVWIETEQDTEERPNGLANPYIDALKSQIEELQADKAYLKEENQRLQLLIAQLTSKIPDPPKEEQKAIEQKSFWQRLLGI